MVDQSTDVHQRPAAAPRPSEGTQSVRVHGDVTISGKPARSISGSRAIGIGASSTVIATIPMFLTGALAVQITRDLAFGPAALGSAVGAYFASIAAVSIYLGRVVDRIGAILSLRFGVAGCALATLGLALTATGWSSLVLWLVLAGISSAVIQPATNRLLIKRVEPARMGMAFGIKQSAPPTASLLAGLSVPVVAVALSWRWAYGLAGLSGLGVLLSIGRRPPDRQQQRRAQETGSPAVNRGTLLAMATGFGLSIAAQSSLLTFYVDAAVGAGESQERAGVLLATASAAAVSTRLLAGGSVDRFRLDPFNVSAVLLVVGAVGLVLMATSLPAVMRAGVIISLVGAWGFPGIFWLALVRSHPSQPGRITGIMAPAALGGVLGPPLFGLIVEGAGYATAWGCAALWAGLASYSMHFGGRRTRAAPAATG